MSPEGREALPLWQSPGGLVSLLEMLDFHADDFLRVIQNLARLEQHARAERTAHKDRRNMYPQDKPRQTVIEDAQYLVDELKRLGLPISLASAQRLLDELNAEIWNNLDLEVRLRDVRDRLYDELAERKFFLIPPDKIKFYTNGPQLFGATVVNNFPSITYEIDEAGKCLACDRTTAAAFHAIRCLEAGIKSISRFLNIPDPTKGAARSWHNLLAAIDVEVQKRWPRSQIATGGDAEFFYDAYATLAAIQNPWRNATMHLDQKYTEEEARHILAAVEVFMKKLATRMDENGQSIG